MIEITPAAALLVLVFGTALGYAAGRADLRDLGPWRRKPRVYRVESHNVIRILQGRVK